MRFKAVIVGLGNIGLLYDKENFNNSTSCLTHTKAIQNFKEFDLIGGVDINEENRDLFHKLTGRTSYKSLKVLKDKIKEVDIFIVSTPTHTHLSIMNEVFNHYNPSVILCEKPLSYVLDETEKIINLCKKNKTELFINFPRRLEKSVNKIKTEITEASFIKGAVWYSNGLLNNGIHFIDLMAHLFGKAKTIDFLQLNYKYTDLRNDFDADFKISYEKGDIYFLSWKEELFSHYKIEILSNKSRYILDNNGFQSKLNKVVPDPNYSGYMCLSPKEEEIQNNLDNSIKLVYNDILKYLEKNNEMSLLNNLHIIKEVHNTVDELKKTIYG